MQMKLPTCAAALALVSISWSACAAVPAFDAAAAQQLARQNACFGCHQVDRKVVGPAFQQIAAKYKGDAGAEAKLAARIKLGGSGDWGVIPMPAHPNMSDADLHTLSRWILAGAPAK
jgi:cytochrome c